MGGEDAEEVSELYFSVSKLPYLFTLFVPSWFCDDLPACQHVIFEFFIQVIFNEKNKHETLCCFLFLILSLGYLNEQNFSLTEDLENCIIHPCDCRSRTKELE